MTQIIGISGVSGAGKSTLAKALAQVLKAPLIQWDDFDDISSGPDDYVAWYTRGQNYAEWDYRTLAEILCSLKNRQSVQHPIHQQILHPGQYIIYDAPMGRLHSQTGRYIDKCLHIALPLDISLSRRLLRDFNNDTNSKTDIFAELEFYMTQSRPLFNDKDLKNNADLVIDGMLSTQIQLRQITDYLST